jgi:hypothetical protein
MYSHDSSRLRLAVLQKVWFDSQISDAKLTAKGDPLVPHSFLGVKDEMEYLWRFSSE